MSQQIVEASTSVIFVLSALLAYYLSKNYAVSRKLSTLFWGAGMWAFSAGVLLEVVFSFGIYDQGLIKLYLFVVAVLVELLAMGSINLTGKKYLVIVYYVFSAASTVLLAASLVYSNIGYILTDYVVYGPLPLYIVITSSIVTFPAALILIAVAGLSYRKRGDTKMLSIIVGTLIVSMAGTLYIAQFPVFLYYAEFIGIILLWLGFFDLRSSKRQKFQQ
ncbi:MAG: hypothetical protein ACP5TZ_06080 [Nitrososphaeria archaeon]